MKDNDRPGWLWRIDRVWLTARRHIAPIRQRLSVSPGIRESADDVIGRICVAMFTKRR